VPVFFLGTIMLMASSVAPAGATGPAPSPSTHKPSAPPSSALARDHNISAGPDRLTLISQSAWVGPGPEQFQLHLAVTASDRAEETLAVIVYGRLFARSQFQAAVSGHVYGPYYFGPGAGNTPVPLDDLVNDPAGGVDVDIPVNAPSGGLSFASTGVYPVQAFLEDNGVRVGQPLTTFIVYVGKDASTLRRLETVLVVPLAAREPISQTGVPAPVPAASASVLEADAAELYLWHVPVTIRAVAATVMSLAESDVAGRDAVGEVRGALVAGDELLPTTELPVDLAALVSAGLTADLQEELSSGSSTLARLLGQAPSPSTWAFSGGVNTATMAALAGMGATQVAVPDGDLSALPPATVNLTFSLPTELAVPGRTIRVMGADSELSPRTAQASVPGQTALVANQVLAELAMVDLEAPGHLRGIVVAPAPGAVLSPGFLSVVLAGLHGNPLLNAVTLAQMFRDLSVADQANGRPLVRQLEGQVVAPLGGTELLATARATVSADGELYGHGSPLVGALDRELEVSLSAAFSTSQRRAMIGAALRAAVSDLSKVRLPPSTSITLTSRQGRLPLTLLSSAGTPVRVLLVLTSEQLSFVDAKFGGVGTCRPVNPGSEDCQLTLSRSTTTLQVPVVVRTSGAFPLALQLATPSGSEEIAAGTDTVRSTAISDVGLVLMVSAALFLAVWWARNARHGRRARRLVPRPGDDEDNGTAGQADNVEHAGTVTRASR
jgi:hypothetical protein